MSFNGEFNNVSIQFKGSASTVALKNWEALALVTILNFRYAMKVERYKIPIAQVIKC